jgi:hypothetical protein
MAGKTATRVESCVRERVRTWIFPPSQRGEANYLFTLTFAPKGFEK